MGKVYQNDVGTIIELSTGVDLTNATVLKMKIKKPDGTILTPTATVYGDPTDGKIRYSVVAGDLDLVGDYYVASYVEFGTEKFTGETAKFEVFPPFG